MRSAVYSRRAPALRPAAAWASGKSPQRLKPFSQNRFGFLWRFWSDTGYSPKGNRISPVKSHRTAGYPSSRLERIRLLLQGSGCGLGARRTVGFRRRGVMVVSGEAAPWCGRELRPQRPSVRNGRLGRRRGRPGSWCLAGLNAARVGRLAAVAAVFFAVLIAGSAPANAVVIWHPKAAPLPTPWTHLVGPDNALPDYPRPQMARTNWLNLNGVWGYMGRSAGTVLAAPPSPDAYHEISGRLPRTDPGPLSRGVGPVRHRATR